MAETNLKKSKQGYGYKYTELAQINDYLESKGIEYYQFTQTEEGNEFIYTVPIVEGKELPARRGCRIIQAPLSGKSNPAQEQGSAITYARRYSLLMAFGLATEDDDAESLTRKQDGKPTGAQIENAKALEVNVTMDQLKKAMEDRGITEEEICKVYCIKSMAEFTQTKAINAMKHIDEIKAQAGGKKK